jgi:hypothetical protein
MMLSRISAAVFGAVALTVSAFAVAPAQAAPVAAAPMQAMPAGDLVEQAQYYGPRPYYRPRPQYRPNYRPYRPYARPPVYRPACYMQQRRVWNGYNWVMRPVRVCR